MSDTEAEALHAGDTWWEAELFSGNPDWSKLHAIREPRLSAEEQNFLEGPCTRLCEMIDDWRINRETADLPPEVWQFMREHRFFGMIIPKDKGGLEFSAFAHSEVVRYLSGRSITAAVTVMVPNSLGPGELLLQFGTEEQQAHWLPRLADGREIPAFGLTSEEAGSDASAMVDSGIVCKGRWNGEEVLGIRLNWSKRYITLAPVCTVLGLAFKLFDPDRLLRDNEKIGITCALVPMHLPGVDAGRRHIPASTMFQNGPTTGRDVFVPLDHIIGGPGYAGRGWMMLMSALAAGRGISLPSLAAAAIALAAHSSGAYARVREQFHRPIGEFGGVQERLGRLASTAYSVDAARRLTCAGLDEGRSLAVVSAIMKAHATFRMREALNDATDVHSGKAVIEGPLNYLAPLYRATPLAITVEGANVVTRSLIIFGQGAIRAHPHLLQEMEALQNEDAEASFEAFDRHFWAHVGHTVRTLGRATGRAWSGGRFAPAPAAGPATPIYRQASRWSAAFALVVEATLLTLGGALKRKEMISARLGDVLSELYFLSAVLKRWEDDGRPEADLPLVRHVAADGFAKVRNSLDEVLANMPSRSTAALLRLAIRLYGSWRDPDDRLVKACSDLLLQPSASRDRIVGRLFGGCRRDGVELLNQAYDKVVAAEPIRDKLRHLKLSPDSAVARGALTPAEREQLEDMERAVREVVRVDDFAPDELARYFPDYIGRNDNNEEAAA